jgi:hypothetical protein
VAARRSATARWGADCTDHFKISRTETEKQSDNFQDGIREILKRSV